MPTEHERVLGCLLGGAIGDALGAPIEFDHLADIRARHGAEGVTRFLPAYGTVGAITDDTQMSLFTAEGLLRAQAGRDQGGKADDVASIRRAYLRWLRTQDGSVRSVQPTSPSTATNLSSGFSFVQFLSDRLWDKHRFRAAEDGGWLLDQPVLHHQRAPGTTCLSALYEGGRGTPDEPLNNSKGCGGVMRVAPVGALPGRWFAIGVGAAALTHGHPSGYLPAGVLAHVVGALVRGATLPDAITAARVELEQWPDHEETTRAIDQAVALAMRGPIAGEHLETLGGGWVGEEALAIGLCCALAAPDVRTGVELAVNHSGDSDSTGSITGNLLGAMHGVHALPHDLIATLEGRQIVATVAGDLADVFLHHRPVDVARYPAD
jgi:ADP-ribosylglycohydrolase